MANQEQGCPFDEAGPVGSQKNDTCPKCGADSCKVFLGQPDHIDIYQGLCGSKFTKTLFYQSEKCKIRQLENALAAAQAEIERLKKVEEAAKKAAYSNKFSDIYELRKAVEG